jgi:hypothetical protein
MYANPRRTAVYISQQDDATIGMMLFKPLSMTPFTVG